MDLIIKLASYTDFLPLANFFKSNNIDEVIKNFNPFPLNAKTACEITLKKRKDRFYVSYLENKIIGLVMLRGWEAGYEIPSFGILIDHKYHHQGIGKQLTNYALEEAKKIGCRKVRLSVFAENSVALYLYESLRFKEIGRELVTINGEQKIKIIMLIDL